MPRANNQNIVHSRALSGKSVPRGTWLFTQAEAPEELVQKILNARLARYSIECITRMAKVLSRNDDIRLAGRLSYSIARCRNQFGLTPIQRDCIFTRKKSARPCCDELLQFGQTFAGQG